MFLHKRHIQRGRCKPGKSYSISNIDIQHRLRSGSKRRLNRLERKKENAVLVVVNTPAPCINWSSRESSLEGSHLLRSLSDEAHEMDCIFSNCTFLCHSTMSCCMHSESAACPGLWCSERFFLLVVSLTRRATCRAASLCRNGN